MPPGGKQTRGYHRRRGRRSARICRRRRWRRGSRSARTAPGRGRGRAGRIAESFQPPQVHHVDHRANDHAGFLKKRVAGARGLPMFLGVLNGEVTATGFYHRGRIVFQALQKELIAVAARLALDNPLATEVRATEVRATEVRATEVRATEVRATEVRATEVRATEVRATEVRATEVRATEARAT